mgnify:CR=1 FL=1
MKDTTDTTNNEENEDHGLAEAPAGVKAKEQGAGDTSNYQTQSNFFHANFPGSGQGQWSAGN